MIALDTHTWIWWAADRDKLPHTLVQRLLKEDSLVISAISCWEVAMLVEKGRLVLRSGARAGIRALVSIPFLRVEPVTQEIAVQAGLIQLKHGDPADRLILSTADVFGLELATRDRALRSASARVIWD